MAQDLVEITRKDLLTPLSEYEEKHNITETRDDMPKFNFDPSEHYKTVDMNGSNLEKLRNNVDRLLIKLGYKTPHYHSP